MLEFVKKENTRFDFGVIFDRFIEKDWSRRYFKNRDAVERCLEILGNYAKAYNPNCESDMGLQKLFYDKDFIDSPFCSDLLNIFVNELFVLPTHSVEWKENEIKVSENYFWTEVYETEYLPFYYILNCGESNWPFLLLNKETGSVLDLYIE